MLVYVLHFVDPKTLAPARVADHAGHYIGFCARGLESRVGYHRAGRGSRLVKALVERGGDVVVAFSTAGDRTLERRLKKWMNTARRLCPVCRDDATIRRHYRTGRVFVAFRPHKRDSYEKRVRGL